MPTESEVEFDFSSQFQPLQEEFQKDTPDVAKFNAAYQGLNDARLELQHIVESIVEKTKDNKEFRNLYNRIAHKNETQVLERLRTIGYYLGLKKPNEKNPMREAFERQGYRLLEQTRAGKRDNVYYGILRIFVSLQREFPLELVEAFKPVYSEEMFKVFLFSFLSGVLGKQEENE